MAPLGDHWVQSPVLPMGLARCEWRYRACPTHRGGCPHSPHSDLLGWAGPSAWLPHFLGGAIRGTGPEARTLVRPVSTEALLLHEGFSHLSATWNCPQPSTASRTGGIICFCPERRSDCLTLPGTFTAQTGLESDSRGRLTPCTHQNSGPTLRLCL